MSDQEDEILVRVIENPEISSKYMPSGTGLSKSSILRILNRENLCSYHFTSVQNLVPSDPPARL